jgi:YidC/Oxa1 family membrane protein insertase
MFKNAIFLAISWLYGLCGDWGLAIILITVIFRLLIMPLTVKQTNSAYRMQKVQPKLKELQEKYADDKVRLQEEQLKLYSEAKFNPLAGCLPMLLQMPIFMALFQVLRELTSLITAAGHPAEVLPASFFTLIPDLSIAASQVFSFSADGFIAAIPYVIMLLLFGSSMLVPMLTNPNMESSMLMITIMMSVSMLWFGWTTPAGVLLYWDTSSIIGIAQTLISRALNKRKDAEEEEQVELKPVKVEVERKERKSRPHKSR